MDIAPSTDQLLDLRNPSTGTAYRGRFVGTLVARDGDTEVYYLPEEERLIVYDRTHLSHWGCPRDSAAEKLDGALGKDAYVQVMEVLGLPPIIDI